MEKKVLEIFPLGGLGNRLRTVFSFKNFADQNGFQFKVNWLIHDECCCRFEDILIPSFDIVNSKQILPVKMRSALINLRLYRRNSPLSKYIIDKEVWHQTVDFAGLVEDCQVFTSHGLGRMILSENDFIEHIRNDSDDLKAQLPVKYNAFHIRTGDNKISMKGTDLQALKDKMDSLIHKGETVYLATDSVSLKQELLGKFGDRIVVQKDISGRNSVQGMKQAAVDFLVLAGAEHIHASFYTSFSQIAAQMGNASLTNYKKPSADSLMPIVPKG